MVEAFAQACLEGEPAPKHLSPTLNSFERAMVHEVSCEGEDQDQDPRPHPAPPEVAEGLGLSHDSVGKAASPPLTRSRPSAEP